MDKNGNNAFDTVHGSLPPEHTGSAEVPMKQPSSMQPPVVHSSSDHIIYVVIAVIIVIIVMVTGVTYITYYQITQLVKKSSTPQYTVGMLASTSAKSNDLLTESVSVIYSTGALHLGQVGFKVVSNNNSRLLVVNISYTSFTGGSAILYGNMWTYTAPASANTPVLGGDTIMIIYTITSTGGPQTGFKGFSIVAYG